MPDTLIVKVSEDAWNGDAQFTIDLDGVQIVGPTSVQASHSAGQLEELAFAGDFGPGPHTVAINFINDAWGGTVDTDRNLYVTGITFDNNNYAGQTAADTAMGGAPETDPNAAEMFTGGTVTFTNVTAGSSTTAFLGGDIVIGSSADDWIGVGDGDTLTGGGGRDNFVMDIPSGSGPRHDEITDFQTGRGGDGNELVETGLTFPVNGHYTAYNFDAVYNAMTDVAGGTVFTWNGTSVLFDHVSRDDFNADNFSYQDFGSPKSPLNGTEAQLTVRVSEDASNGDAQFRVMVDGHQMSGLETVTASHSAGGVQEFTYGGQFASDFFPDGPHTVEVQFVNAAGGGTPDTGRHLYVEGVTWTAWPDGHSQPGVTTTYSGQTAANTGAGPDTDPNAAEVYSDGTVSFTNVGGSAPPPPPPPGSDTLVLHLSEDAWNGDAQFNVLLDGKQIGGPTSVTTLHSTGTFQDFTYAGDFGAGPHTVEIDFLNDAWGGTTATDRNMYVGGITFDGVSYAGQTAQDTAMGGAPETDPNAAEMFTNGAVTFTNVGGSSPPPPPPSGESTIVLHVSEDAWNGDAQFVVSVDGVQQGGVRTATASHAAGAVQDMTITGDFGAQGPGTVDVTFRNDAWGGSAATDRNLYVQGIDINGVHFAGNAAINNAANGAEATDPTAAVMAINGTADFAINHTAPPAIMG
jgi:hypothetical protein